MADGKLKLCIVCGRPVGQVGPGLLLGGTTVQWAMVAPTRNPASMQPVTFCRDCYVVRDPFIAWLNNQMIGELQYDRIIARVRGALW